jgi:hypothetical protein
VKYIFKALSNLIEKVGSTKFHYALREDPNGQPKYMVAWLARNINYFEDGTSNQNKPLSEIITLGGTASSAINMEVNGQVYVNDNTKPWYRLDGETSGALTQSDYYANGQYNLSAVPILIPIVKSGTTDCANDMTPPVFANCPANIALITTSTSAVATWNAPTATDLCPGVVSVNGTYASGASFPIGSTTVVYTATDVRNNTVTCSFNVTVTLQTGGGTGCAYTSTPTPSNLPWEFWIKSVQFGTINNTSQTNEGKYKDYNSLGYSNFQNNFSTEVNRGQTLPITIIFGGAWALPQLYCGVWIDFNQNGSFEDNERVLGEAGLTGQRNIVIPTTATAGTTRMRIILKNGALPTACDFSNYRGEVEDYSIVILGGPNPCDNDMTPPVFTTCPEDINLTTPSSSAIANWTAPNATDNCGMPTITGNRNSGESFPIGTTNVTYTAVDARGNFSTCTFAIRVTEASGGTGCAYATIPTPQNVPWNYWIKGVKVASIDNLNQANDGKFLNYNSLGYSDFVNFRTDMRKGQTYTLTLEAGDGNWSGNWPLINYSVWIDYNLNGAFEANEQVFVTQNGIPSATSTASITIPNTALIGSTRMRVILKYSAELTNPCDFNFAAGEVEDYTIDIKNGTQIILWGGMGNGRVIIGGNGGGEIEGIEGIKIKVNKFNSLQEYKVSPNPTTGNMTFDIVSQVKRINFYTLLTKGFFL